MYYIYNDYNIYYYYYYIYNRIHLHNPLNICKES